MLEVSLSTSDMIKIRKAISLKYRCRNLSYLSTCNDSVKWFPFVMFSGPTSRVPLFGHHPFFSVAVPKFSQTELNWMLMTTKELQFLLCATGSVRLVGMNSFHGPFLIPTHTIATHTHCLRRLERKGATIRDYPVCPFSRNSMMMMCNIDQRDTLLPVAESSDNQGTFSAEGEGTNELTDVPMRLPTPIDEGYSLASNHSFFLTSSSSSSCLQP